MTIPEHQLLFLSLRQDFSATFREAVSKLAAGTPIRWDVVYATADGHGVSPLVYQNLFTTPGLTLDAPPDVQERFKQNTYRQVIRKQRAAERVSKALAYLNPRGMDAMLVKGAALDFLVYDQPWYTASGDIDLVIRRRLRDFPAAELSSLQAYFHGSGIEYDFYAHHDLNINGVLPVDFDRIWADASQVSFLEYTAYVMAPEDMLISVCVNSCRKRFFRLKSLCDIAETVRKYPSMDWDKLVYKSRAYDCHPIVYTALMIADQTLGCPLPPGLPQKLDVGFARQKIIDRFILVMLRKPALFSYPTAGPTLFGRRMNWALILPYMNYRGYQIWRKLALI